MKFLSFCRLWTVAVAGSCVFAATSTAVAQGAPASPREAVAIGAVVTPALEGGGPWVLAGAKANTRLSERLGLSVEANRIWGSNNGVSEFRQSYTASMLIYSRQASPAQSYWFVGPQLIRGRKLDGNSIAVHSDSHSALSIGHGWSQLTARHVRVAGEIGFSGGDGYMIFGSLVVQFAHARQP